MLEIVRPLRWEQDALVLLYQTLLPGEEKWIRLTTPEQVIEAIPILRVRGAPAIGCAGAYAMVLAAGTAAEVRAAAPAISEARPTAVYRRAFTGGIAGLGTGDIDGDGDLDVVAAVRLVGSDRIDLWTLN